jgi:hypothetical protein
MALALVLLSLPVGVSAGLHRAGGGGGGGGGFKSTLGGVVLSVEFVLDNAGAVTSFGGQKWTFSLVGDFSLLSGRHDGPLTQYTTVFGPRATWNLARGFQPFVHGLVGGYWEVQSGESSRALVGGFGVDVPWDPEHGEHRTARVIRVQVDRYEVGVDSADYWQVSALFILRFH